MGGILERAALRAATFTTGAANAARTRSGPSAARPATTTDEITTTTTRFFMVPSSSRGPISTIARRISCIHWSAGPGAVRSCRSIKRAVRMSRAGSGVRWPASPARQRIRSRRGTHRWPASHVRGRFFQQSPLACLFHRPSRFTYLSVSIRAVTRAALAVDGRADAVREGGRGHDEHDASGNGSIIVRRRGRGRIDARLRPKSRLDRRSGEAGRGIVGKDPGCAFGATAGAGQDQSGTLTSVPHPCCRLRACPP